MGYLQELKAELRQMLGDLDEAKQEEIARCVGRKILKRYHNGIESVKVLEAGKKAAERAANARRAE
jgi:hypothetical protein